MEKDMSIIADMNKDRNKERIGRFHLNTNTIVDIATGKYLKAIDGRDRLNGGMFTINSSIGRAQTYKTTKILSYLSRILHIYPECEAIIYDTENSIQSKDRLAALKGDLPIPTSDDFKDRIIIIDKSEKDMDSFAEMLKDIANQRIKMANELIAETPFKNVYTGQSMTMRIPLLLGIDSWSAMQSLAEIDMFKDNGLSDQGINRINIVDGNKKAVFLRNLVNLASIAGIYVFLTAHIGDLIKLNMFDTSSKDLQYMKNSDKLKGASSGFAFYSINLFDSRGVSALVDATNKDECKFPDLSLTPDLSLVKTGIIKCKNNMSGTVLDDVLSQHEGILAGLSNYVNLDEAKFGIGGNNVHKNCAILPDTSFTRKKIRSLLNTDYELSRALEILSDIMYMKKYWRIEKDSYLEKLCNISDEQLIKMFLDKKGAVLDDILNSRGYWTFNESTKKDLRPYMGIPDIIDLLEKEVKIELTEQQKQVAKSRGQIK
jgi:hypothetical protein